MDNQQWFGFQPLSGAKPEPLHAVLLVEQKAQAALRLAHTASVLVQGQVVMSAPAAEVLASRDMAEVFLGGRGRRPK